jgi:exosortase
MKWFNDILPPLPGRPPAGALSVGIGLAGLCMGFCGLLWSEWRHNPDLSHGFFAPPIFGLLVWLSRRIGPCRWVKSGYLSQVLLLLCLVGGLTLFALAGLFAASLGWSHALVLFLLALTLATFLLGGLLILADERVRVLPFNWINLTAILLWVLVAPVPNGTYAKLTLGLQAHVTDGVMTVLQFLGVPARQHGNVIELAQTTVGVEEACSGVRSLISCIYAGFFFAAWQVRKPWRRLVLILVAPLLALGMNFLRSLVLTLLANSGVNISGGWHDATGFSILGLTAAILGGLAILLESKPTGLNPPSPNPGTVVFPPWPYRIFWLFAGLTLALAIFFQVNSRVSTQAATVAPELAELLPAEPPGWQVMTPKDLYRFSGILQTTDLLQRLYVRPTERGTVEFTIYVAHWAPGQTTVSRVASHTPDACWPGAGWTPQPTGGGRTQAVALPGLILAPAEYRIFRNEFGHNQNVWFWHIFDGRAIDYRDPYSLPALLQIALQYGFRRQGTQYFVRISSNRSWDEIAEEPLLREILSNLDRVGL